MKSLKERIKIYKVLKVANMVRVRYTICPRCWRNYPINRDECPHCRNQREIEKRL